jgi:hypothetical protein
MVTMNEDIRCSNPACALPDDVQKVRLVAHGDPPQRFEAFTSGADSDSNYWSDQLAAPPTIGARWGCMVTGVLVVGIFGLCSSARALSYALNPNAIYQTEGSAPENPPVLAPLALGCSYLPHGYS